MAHINFNLRKQAAQTPQSIYMVVRWQGKKLVYPTGLKVLPKNWDVQKQCVKAVISEPNKALTNSYLKTLSEEVTRLYTEVISQRQAISLEVIKRGLDIFTNKENETRTLFTFIENFISGSHSRINPQSGKLISPRTIQKYKTTQTLLADFSKIYKQPIDFDSIDLLFYESFSTYMIQVKKYSMNTIGKHISILKDWLNEATRKGLNKKLDYKGKSFKAHSMAGFAVYSDISELIRVYNFDLSQSRRLERVRDLFIIGAFTGFRYSDFTAIRQEHIKDTTIELYQSKTGAKVIVPIHWTVKAILAKYGGVAPESISNQKMNEYIKEVYEQAGITEKIEYPETKEGVKVMKLVEKWKLISTHTARRSFATNAYLLKVPAHTIMKITGHTTEKAFMKYLRLNNAEHATIMHNIWQASSPLKAVN